jgi:hypothetical protein
MSDGAIASIFLIVGLSVLIPTCEALNGGHACGEMSGPTVTGKVLKIGTSRYVGGTENGQEKLPLVLQGLTTDATLANNPKAKCERAPGDYLVWDCQLTVECLSTSCGLINEGETHDFNCWSVARLTSVNVIQCRAR